MYGILECRDVDVCPVGVKSSSRAMLPLMADFVAAVRRYQDCWSGVRWPSHRCGSVPMPSRKHFTSTPYDISRCRLVPYSRLKTLFRALLLPCLFCPHPASYPRFKQSCLHGSHNSNGSQACGKVRAQDGGQPDECHRVRVDWRYGSCYPRLGGYTSRSSVCCRRSKQGSLGRC